VQLKTAAQMSVVDDTTLL